jgi:hypothetical protein
MLTPGTLIFASMPMINILPAILVKWGNPQNMKIWVSCFLRDILDAVILHQTGVVHYLRPEMTGFVPASFIAGRSLGEFRTRGDFIPLVRFLLAM